MLTPFWSCKSWVYPGHCRRPCSFFGRTGTETTAGGWRIRQKANETHSKKHRLEEKRLNSL